MTTITDAARLIAEIHNGYNGQEGGFLLFHRDGSGGQWYSDDSMPDMSADSIRVPNSHRLMTPADAQAILDGQPEQVPLYEGDELIGYAGFEREDRA